VFQKKDSHNKTEILLKVAYKVVGYRIFIILLTFNMSEIYFWFFFWSNNSVKVYVEQMDPGEEDDDFGDFGGFEVQNIFFP
jgi:hypothetical protein